ncbi:hypothetical protein BHE74_00056189 [Ensete ventricosum]|nr:hypothetical protein BHE74_00056189 [Ensete ventricosum]RZR91538.1 hypothetical protein BHM03_00019678 [Ensete ventricosum]
MVIVDEHVNLDVAHQTFSKATDCIRVTWDCLRWCRTARVAWDRVAWNRAGGDSMSGHRAYARAMVEKPPHQEKGPKITSEAREAEYPDHDSALVILIRIANARGQDSDSGHWELRRRAIPRVLLEAQLD